MARAEKLKSGRGGGRHVSDLQCAPVVAARTDNHHHHDKWSDAGLTLALSHVSMLIDSESGVNVIRTAHLFVTMTDSEAQFS